MIVLASIAAYLFVGAVLVGAWNVDFDSGVEERVLFMVFWPVAIIYKVGTWIGDSWRLR